MKPALTLAQDMGRQAAEVKPILMATKMGKTIGCCARNAGRLFHEEEKGISMSRFWCVLHVLNCQMVSLLDHVFLAFTP